MSECSVSDNDADFSSDDDVIDPSFTITNCKKRRLCLVKTLEDGHSASKNKKSELSHTEPTSFDVNATENCSPNENNVSCASIEETPLLFREFFEVIENPTLSSMTIKKNKSVSAKCRYCSVIITGYFTVTSNFIRHLRKQHVEKMKEYEEGKRIKNVKKTSQSHFNKLVLTHIIKNMLPISIVESVSFRQMIQYSNPTLKVLSRPSAMKLLDKTYDNMKQNFRGIVKSRQFFGTTADIWSTKHRSFFGFTCHWIDETFQRHSVALACKRFCGTHTYDAIQRKIVEIHEDFGLTVENVVAVTTDNGSNFVKAFKEFGLIDFRSISKDTDFEEEWTLLEENSDISRQPLNLLLPNHFRCASHTLHLIATTDFNNILKSNLIGYEKHKSILKKCSGLWSKINRPKSSEKIISVIGSQLKYPVVTRWNSLFDSIQHILYHRAKINELCRELQIDAFLECDFEYLLEYVELMKPIAEAIDFLQSEKGMFFGYLLPTIATMKTKYARLLMKSSSDYVLEIANKLLSALENRFDTLINLKKGSEFAVVASVLCPSVKLKWILAINTAFNSLKEVEVMETVKTTLSIFFQDAVAEELSQPDDSDMSKYFAFDIMTETLEDQSPESPEWQSQLLAYISDTKKGFEMLNNYKFIKLAFSKFNCPLPSSAAVERLFSHASLLNTPRRGCLSDVNFEKLLLLKVNNIV